MFCGCRKDPPPPAPVVVAPSVPDRDYFVVRVNGKEGYIDRTGKIVIQPQFDKAFPFTEGLAAAASGGAWGYIDGSGSWVIRPAYAMAARFSEGRAAVKDTFGSKYGYIDKTGTMVIPERYDCAEDFRNGAAEVGTAQLLSQIHTKFADVGITCDVHYIDHAGNRVAAPPSLPAPPPFRLTPFNTGGLRGYQDGRRQVVIKPQFAYAAPFERGLALFTIREGEDILAGYIDEQGTVVWPASR
jgi:hypothetical protein